MQVYRIVKQNRARDLTGEGARLFGGRWNSAGTPMIYTAESVSLATLEVLVHTTLNCIPRNLVLVILEIPDHVSILPLESSNLSQNWFLYPAPPECMKMGDRWSRKNESAILQVPSAIIPESEEYNYLLNPLHNDFHNITIKQIKPYSFDRRLYDNH